MTLSIVKNGIRAAVVAVALVGGSLGAAAPAQAQVSFNLSFGDFLPGPRPGPHLVLRFGSPDYFRYCLTDSQVVKSLRQKGYRQIDLVRFQNSSNKVWVTARLKTHWYQLRVDRCTGKVDRVTRIDNLRLPNGNFSLTFNF